MGLGCVLYEWNELEASKQHLLRALELNIVGSSAGLHIRCHSTLALICEAQGHPSTAQEHVDRIAEHRQMTSHQEAMSWAGETGALILLRHGDTSAAVAWLEQLGVTADTVVRPEVDDALLMLARLLLAMGNAHESGVILQRLRAAPEKHKYIDEVLPVMLVQAQAYQAAGETAEAATVLAFALALAEPGGYMRTFVDEGTGLLPLLRAIEQSVAKQSRSSGAETQCPSAAYVRHLVAQYQTQDVSQANASSSVPPISTFLRWEGTFTARESEIVEQLLLGRSNDEIAQTLVIMPSTLKWHLGHIYAKLSAHNRFEALVRLQQMTGPSPF